MHNHNRLLATLLAAGLATQTLCSSNQASAATVVAADDDDLDPSLRMPVRRLHPERHTETDSGWVAKMKHGQKGAGQEHEQAVSASEEKAREREERYRRLAAEKTGTKYLTPEERAERNRREKAVLDSLLDVDYTLPDIGPETSRLTWHNDPIGESVQELAAHLYCKKLEGGGKLYHSTAVTIDTLSNGLFLYFDVQNGRPGQLRLRGQYCADDPLGIESVSFVINGYTYEFQPGIVTMGRSGRKFYWECFDRQLSDIDKDLVYALAHCKWARVIFVGERGINHVKKITAEQTKDFYYTLTLYRKLGGTL